jgi:hypothetical protein
MIRRTSYSRLRARMLGLSVIEGSPKVLTDPTLYIVGKRGNLWLTGREQEHPDEILWSLPPERDTDERVEESKKKAG